MTDHERIEHVCRQLRELPCALPVEAWIDLELTMTQLKALLLIRSRTPVTLNEVAGRLGNTAASASALTMRLFDQGLITRSENSQDRRQVHFGLTETGAAILDRLHGDASCRLAHALQRMSPFALGALEVGLRALAREIASELDGTKPPRASGTTTTPTSTQSRSPASVRR